MGKNNKKELHPADQARKAWRKKELKRNKKNRLEQRQFTLARKTPDEILDEINRIRRLITAGLADGHANAKLKTLKAAHQAALDKQKEDQKLEKEKKEKGDVPDLIIKGLGKIIGKSVVKKLEEPVESETGGVSAPTDANKMDVNEAEKEELSPTDEAYKELEMQVEMKTLLAEPPGLPRPPGLPPPVIGDPAAIRMPAQMPSLAPMGMIGGPGMPPRFGMVGPFDPRGPMAMPMFPGMMGPPSPFPPMPMPAIGAMPPRIGMGPAAVPSAGRPAMAGMASGRPGMRGGRPMPRNAQMAVDPLDPNPESNPAYTFSKQEENEKLQHQRKMAEEYGEDHPAAQPQAPEKPVAPLAPVPPPQPQFSPMNPHMQQSYQQLSGPGDRIPSIISAAAELASVSMPTAIPSASHQLVPPSLLVRRRQAAAIPSRRVTAAPTRASKSQRKDKEAAPQASSTDAVDGFLKELEGLL
eukprot:gb/GEZN01004964.1/.p1 GENE.gb/GEZN01004964.1/~~gb/GEZN01004964.1/.p1  ORF type:complete len:468 (+),score=92.24 gb/GEZN01004964.1/:224-1627(+)